MESNILSVHNLSVAFGEQEAVKDISFTIQNGEILAVVGESGSGKSVTSLSLLRLLPRMADIKGDILFEEKGSPPVNVVKVSENGLQQIRGDKIAMVFQEPMTSLNPVKTCGSQVSEALLLHKKISRQQAVQQVISLFEQVQLPDPVHLYHRYPHEISGGQKQRVMIAMAMSCRPQLLICDEPTTALDVLVQRDIILLIKKLQSETGMSVLFISHDINLVAEIADRIAIFYKGEMVETGTTEAILHSPKHPYTRALLACRPALYQPGERLPVVAGFLGDKPPEAIAPLKKQEPAQPAAKAPSRVLLSVQHLNVWYPARRNFFGRIREYNKAVNDISFDVFEGETLGLVGGSGCGKTTLGRAVLQLTAVHSGKILFKGQNILAMPAQQVSALAKEIQMIFQDPYSSLNPKIPIGKAIEEPLRVHHIYPEKEISSKVMEWLKKVGLEQDHYHRYPHEFSGGQRQRIVIARALAMQPAFVICDESVSALDVSVQAQVLNLLNDLKKELHFTAIFISHDLSVVKYLCERILVMNKGSIEEAGTAAQVYDHPQTAYTQSLLEALPKAVYPRLIR